MKKKQTATSSFSDQYKDPRWQKKRLQILERDEFTCHDCGDTKSTLHAHHLFYSQGKKIWEYNDDLLLTLCETCHEMVHSTSVLDFTVDELYDRKMSSPLNASVVARIIGTAITYCSSKKDEEAVIMSFLSTVRMLKRIKCGDCK